MTALRSHRKKGLTSAFTIPEVLMAALLVAVFFGAIFEVNAICLRYISASKENIGGVEGVHDRLEQLRNTSFSSLTTVGAMKTLLAQAADNSPIVKRAVETVVISGYPSGNPIVTFTRAANGTVTSVPATVDFSGTALVKVDVSNRWQGTFVGQTRTSQASTIISAGTKK